MRPIHLVLLALTLSGCVATEPPIGLAPDSYRPPVRAGCENYADQTARNTYENQIDAEDSLGARLLTRQQAEESGRRAYERCRSGRLN